MSLADFPDYVLAADCSKTPSLPLRLPWPLLADHTDSVPRRGLRSKYPCLELWLTLQLAARSYPDWAEGAAIGVADLLYAMVGHKGAGRFVMVLLAFSVTANTSPTIYSSGFNIQILVPWLLKGECDGPRCWVRLISSTEVLFGYHHYCYLHSYCCEWRATF